MLDGKWNYTVLWRFSNLGRWGCYMARITARFFRVLQNNNNSFPFSKALSMVGQMPIDQRRKSLGNDFEVRLENIEENNGLLVGEMTRIIKEDFPAKVERDILAKLDADELGLCCAFLFDPAISILVMQYEPRHVSPTRMVGYLTSLNVSCSYILEPILNQDAWDRFANGTVRKLFIKVAAPDHFQFAADEDNKLGTNLSALAGSYNSPYISVEISMGGKKGSLLDDIKPHVKNLLGGEVDVRSLRTKIEEDGEQFSLLTDVTHYRKNIPLLSDPSDNSLLRIKFVEDAYSEKRSYLQQMYGAQN